MSRRSRIALSLVLAAVGVLLLTSGWSTPRRAVGCARPIGADTPSPLPAPHVGPGSPHRMAGPVECTPGAGRACDRGDLYFIDSCGARGELAERCGVRHCEGDRCVDPPPGPPCVGVGEGGHCAGDTLLYCNQGRVVSVDCAARGAHCAIDDGGDASCRPGRTPSCPPALVSGRCEGDVLQRCAGDAPAARDCALDGAVCEVAGGEARCVRRRQVSAPAVAADPCLACGCPERPQGEEVCDGYDNDGNGSVDDGAPCEPIHVVAFLIADAAGRTAEAPERVQADAEVLASVLADPEHPTGLSITLEVRALVRPAWLAAPESALDEALLDPAIQQAVPGFFVPVLYLGRLDQGAREPLGVSTLPNGSCADLERPHPGAGSQAGAIALSRVRLPTTLAHELGHFLGLCHTHQRGQPRLVDEPHVTGAGDRERLACPTCNRSGDGICDTPEDAGPDGGCLLDPERCIVDCGGRAAPDARNVMSYYGVCRRWFSQEQAMQMRRYLARRRAWQRCAAAPDGCRCSLETPGPQRCGGPTTMLRCASGDGTAGARCLLAGGGVRGDRCAIDVDCRAGLACAQGFTPPACVDPGAR